MHRSIIMRKSMLILSACEQRTQVQNLDLYANNVQ